MNKEYILSCVISELVEARIIKTDEIPIYYFGLYEGVIFIINVLITLLIAAFVQDVRTGILFMVLYLPIQRYAGGYHADTRKRCFVISIFVVVMAMEMIKIMGVYKRQYLLLISILCASLVAIIAPIENQNKKISVEERKRYKKNLIIILYFESALAVYFCAIENQYLLSNIASVQIISLVLNLMALNKDRKRRKSLL